MGREVLNCVVQGSNPVRNDQGYLCVISIINYRSLQHGWGVNKAYTVNKYSKSPVNIFAREKRTSEY